MGREGGREEGRDGKTCKCSRCQHLGLHTNTSAYLGITPALTTNAILSTGSPSPLQQKRPLATVNVHLQQKRPYRHHPHPHRHHPHPYRHRPHPPLPHTAHLLASPQGPKCLFAGASSSIPATVWTDSVHTAHSSVPEDEDCLLTSFSSASACSLLSSLPVIWSCKPSDTHTHTHTCDTHTHTHAHTHTHTHTHTDNTHAHTREDRQTDRH